MQAYSQITGFKKGFRGDENPTQNLRSQQGIEFSYRSRAIFDTMPTGFYRQWIAESQVVFPSSLDAETINVVFVSECRNYQNQPFSAYVNCPAFYDLDSNEILASLDSDMCNSDESESHTRFNFFNFGHWYIAGRTSYYRSQMCTPKISVQVDGEWQVDPINGSHNFTLDPGSYRPAASMFGF